MSDEDIKLTKFYTDMYNGLRQLPQGYIATGGVAKMIFRSAYNSFVNEKIMTPIEQISLEEKKELTDECRKTGEFFTNETLTERCKALYVIKFINSNT